MRRRDGETKRRSARFQLAFTLIEIMAVVVLVGIAATIVTLRLEGMSTRARLETAATQVEQTMRLAVHEARTRKRPVTLAIDAGIPRLRLERGGREPIDGGWRALEGVTIRDVRMGGQTSRGTDGIARVRITATGVSLPWSLTLRAGELELGLLADGVTGKLERRTVLAIPRGTR